MILIDLREDRRARRGVEDEERSRLPALLEGDGEPREARVRRLDRDFERSGLSDEPLRLADGDGRRRAAAGHEIGGAIAEGQQNDESKKPAQHGSNDTSLVRSTIPTAGRYRLGVRTRGSQPRDRGSNPRTATRNVVTSGFLLLIFQPTLPSRRAAPSVQG